MVTGRTTRYGGILLLLLCSGANYSSPRCARRLPRRKSPATNCCCAPDTSGSCRRASTAICFLAQRSLLKIIAIVREEMDAIGGQEMLLPALHPAEVWQESGRWDVMGDDMFRLKDRFGRDMCLGMTHEEVMTILARGELRSYKQLPQIWYQIQTKFRDEPRPKSGLMRVRQFIMKDSYTFDMDAAGLDVAYQKHYDAYCRIFDRCGLTYLRGGSAFGRDGRQPVARIHGAVGCGRRLRGAVSAVRIQSEPGEGGLAGEGAGRGSGSGGRPDAGGISHAGTEDHRRSGGVHAACRRPRR